MEPILVRPDVGAPVLGISRSEIYKLIRRGDLETVKCGAARLILVDSLRAYVERLREAAREAQ